MKIYCYPIKLIFRGTEYIVDIINLGNKLPYFREFKDEKEIDLTPITVPEEIEDPEKVFEKMLDIIHDESFKYSFQELNPELSWFILYFQSETDILYETPKDIKMYKHLSKLAPDDCHFIDIDPNTIELNDLLQLSSTIIDKMITRPFNTLVINYELLRHFVNHPSFRYLCLVFSNRMKNIDNFLADEIDKKIFQTMNLLYPFLPIEPLD